MYDAYFTTAQHLIYGNRIKNIVVASITVVTRCSLINLLNK